MTDQPSRSAPLAAALLGATDPLAAVISGRTLDAALAETALSATPPTGPLRAAVMDLAYSTLRSFGRGDFLLAQLMAKPLTDIHVRCLLLVTLNRLETRPEHAYAIVDQAVTAASHLAAGNFKGLVNGVLRNFLRRRDALLALADADPVAHGQHPAWWIKRLQQDHPQHWRAILAAGNSHPPMTLRVNHRRIASADFSTRLAAAGIAAHPAGDAGFILEKPMPVERIPGFAEGLCSVQDAGAQRAAGLLDVHAGQRLLDACAAPGGKAAHLLELYDDMDLLALDVDPVRAARISENFVRLGLASPRAVVKVSDAGTPKAWWDGRPFDRILADVPCTASGVVRRHPDAKWLRQPADIKRFAATQARILDALWGTLAGGGKMLYATCSVFAAENEDQVAAFASRHADALRLTIAGAPHLQLLPNAAHDGFFYALLQKT
ncbi:MAG: 16S rRNA (cytosine(967)-C(5))-methyltransferase RsmB [Rugosibacter sp.]|nr:16S rRNA (cytosine(967)-C(5))-methyltransferase RsmB [Rugosibacter sp.]